MDTGESHERGESHLQLYLSQLAAAGFILNVEDLYKEVLFSLDPYLSVHGCQVSIWSVGVVWTPLPRTHPSSDSPLPC